MMMMDSSFSLNPAGAAAPGRAFVEGLAALGSELLGEEFFGSRAGFRADFRAGGAGGNDASTCTSSSSSLAGSDSYFQFEIRLESGSLVDILRAQ
mmetsp:Transcript_35975/g.80916  ORF Transcript_35975/g.80916 Transcript_35975/m.80916 type:complete len:95 (-) Transcript_35975:136-420(-)